MSTPRKPQSIEVTVILPCLNEAETVGQCVTLAKAWIGKKRGEVLVVDNGSTDASVKIAKKAGARVVREHQRGYGAALFKGLSAAKGEYLIIADADMSYDVRRLTPFLQAMKKGSDIVIGNRFSGGVESGAMPWLHQYVGNPALTWIANLFFGTKLGDYHSGVRGLSKTTFQKLQLECVGMEFASEMIVRSALLHLKIAEVPAPYRKDGRDRKPHIRTFRDGWRHLRFLMLFAPNWIFFFPSLFILSASLMLLLWMILDSLQLGVISLGVHTMLVFGALLIIGYQLFHWSMCVHVFAKRLQLPIRSAPIIERAGRLSLETMMFAGVLICGVGVVFCFWTLWIWMSRNFGDLRPEETMRVFIPGIVFIVLGVQVIFSSLFLGLLNFERIQKES